jgi:putative FmdB family regulatory protein
MPIYDYRCQTCGHQFEALVVRNDVPVCSSCGGAKLERLLSMPGVKSESTRDQAMRAAKRRDAAQAADRMHERLRYEKSHDRHG